MPTTNNIFDRVDKLLAGKGEPVIRKRGAIPAKPAAKPKGRDKDAEAFWGDRSNNDRLKILLDKGWESTQVLWEDPVRWIRGSKVGDACSRFQTFKAAGFNVPASARLLRIWALGKALETVVINSMKVAGIYVNEDVVITYAWPPINGHADVLVEIDGNLRLGEIKSINHTAFGKLPPEHPPLLAGQSPLMDTHFSYIMQLNTYLCAENAPTREGFFLFEDKNNQEQKVYWIQADFDLMKPRLRNAEVAGRYILADPQMIAPIPSNRDPVGGDPLCFKCDARSLCKKLPAEAFPIDRARAEER